MRWWIACALLAGCLDQPVHRCDADEDCAGGRCVGEGGGAGVCAVDDAACPSGLAWADDAGDRAGDCVGVIPEDRGYDPCLEVQPPLAIADECIELVCDEEPRCCNREWGPSCVQLAERYCGATCGRIGAFVGVDSFTVGAWDGDEYAPFWAADLTANLRAVAWGDYDLDLRPDLATCDDGSLEDAAIRIWHNEGDRFVEIDQAPTRLNCFDLDWIDLDGDGDLDLVAGGNEWVENQGGGLFTGAEPAVATGFTVEADWANLDEGAAMDAAVSRYEDTFLVRAAGGAGFTTLFESPDLQRFDHVRWGDADGDGRLDLLVSGDALVRVYRNDEDAGFGASAPLFALEEPAAPDAPSSVFLDVDRDGDLDVVALDLSFDAQELVAYRNDLAGGAPGFTDEPLWTSGDAFADAVFHGTLVTGDADGDHVTDLVACAPPDHCRLWYGVGDGTFTPRWDPGGTFEIHGVALVGDWR